MAGDTSTSLPDIIAPGLDVVFCGINPGLSAAQAGYHFLGRGNRFWRAIHLSGFTTQEIRPENDLTILKDGCGLVTLVERPTSGVCALRKSEFILAADRLEQKIAAFAPRYIAFLGKAPYAAIRGLPDVEWGGQAQPFGGASVWLLPNPSERNRSFSLGRLVDCYGDLRRAISQSPKS